MDASLAATTEVNAAGRLDRLPIGRFHWMLFTLIGAGMLFDGLDSYVGSSVLAATTKTGFSNLAENAHFIAATFLGMTIGAMSAGFMGDRLGRRGAYQINLLIFGLASIAGALAPSIFWLVAARLVMGIGIGAEVVCGYVIIGEFMPPAQRARWAGGLAIVTNSALFVAGLLGYFIIPHLGWRCMFAVVGVGSLGVWLFRNKLPESPRWLESKGRFGEAEATLVAIETRVARGGRLPQAATYQVPVSQQQPLSQLFVAPLLGRTVVGSMIVIAVSATLYGFVSWVPTFFVSQGSSIKSSLGFGALMSFGSPLGNAAAMWLAERFGRRPTLIVATLAAAFFGLLYPYSHSGTQIVLIGFLITFFMGVMIGGGWALYVPELFPTRLRMRGVGVCNTAGRLVSIAMPYAVVALFHNFHVLGVTIALSGILVAAAVAVAVLGIETRSRALEELQAEPVTGAALGTGAQS